MKKLLFTIIFLLGCVQLTHAEEFYMPSENEAIRYMESWANKQGYELPVARYFLVNEYNDPRRNTAQKQYIASLIRKVEDVSEKKYRTTPRYIIADGGKTARLFGQIDDTIDEKTATLLAENPNLKTIELVYVPGSFHDEDNHKAGRMIRNAGINTKIKKFGFIASGGTDLLMAGKKRIIAKGATIGVHAWTSPQYSESWNLPTNHVAHNEYLNYFTEMGISSSLYRWTIQNTRPSSIHWLTSEELTNYGF